MLAERVDEGGRDIRDQLHVGLVDGLETLHGRTIERHAVGEGVVNEFAGRDGEVLLNADQIGETHGDVLDASLLISASTSSGVWAKILFSATIAPLFLRTCLRTYNRQV